MKSDPNRAPSPSLLRWTLGFVYFYFGLLKFFPDLSPAELIATQTIIKLSWAKLDAGTALRLLAYLECAIGLGFLADRWRRLIIPLFFVHMVGTFLPLFLLPELTFKVAPFAPTFEGQYILKNLVFTAAGWTLLLPEIFGFTPKKETETGTPRTQSPETTTPIYEQSS